MTILCLIIVLCLKLSVMNFFAPSGLHGLPRRTGKLNDISKFDASFFGTLPKQAAVMDPQLRLLLEVSYEAILDGGKPLNR